ncbi:MAG: DegV family protein [Oscillospiraceae bacterium]|nr:DegV family protein [Oscillospiraceae bacterium]MBR6207695.1 DegV family protein [Oscillospiraceae bacterium]
MKKPVVITADSTVDLSPELLERYQIRTLPLTIILGEEEYQDGVNFSPADMYARYHKDGLLPKTAAPSVQDFDNFFRPLVEAGYEVLHLDISSDLSNTYNAARLAAQELEGVYTVDSRMLSTGIGLLAIESAECAARGMSAREIAAHLYELREKVSTSFVLDTLEFMWKGGRCTGVEALGANLLKLKPALEMKDGKLGVYKKYRGNMAQVYRKYITERLSGKKIRPGHIFLTESGEIEPEVVEELTALVKELSGCREVHHTVAGCTVSSHCGPRTLGVLFIEE